MAAKRFFDGDEDQPNQKRIKIRPSFASVIKEVVMVNFFENFCSALEPMLRRVVSEEVENGLKQRCMGLGPTPMQRSPSLKMIRHAPPTASLRLAFVKTLTLPIFTGTKIVDADGGPLQIVLVDHDKVPTSLPHAIKVEIVVVDGDFPAGKDAWSADEFARNIVKERNGKRPLLAGDQLSITMRDGVCFVGDVEFTDNSSWIRSRKFRLAARVVAQHAQAHPPVIQEAVTDPFVVKDHRGELYKKHHPPALEDEVWRLEKIGKGGAFHQKLSAQGINTVQDFLKLYVVDSPKLKKILGVGMSEKMWDVTLKHAKNCVMGTKMYRCHGNNYTLIFNPICQLIKAEFNGSVYHQRDFKNMQMAYIESLVKDAYAKWSSLEELDGTIPLLTPGEMVEQQQLVAYLSDSSLSSVMQNSGVVDGDYSDNQWGLAYNTTINSCTSKTGLSFLSESSSEGDIP
ncbi:protein SAR DEFICIENT 1 [Salvia miltiorrhiza]|uniref:protein SAR DEFICIENT 1 n=1 Tax=Salvia miltiorrhiza TaxID=226208 RepID=UPI0025ABD749|nr:protein SAR DEFICIENT 1 [Salvia miltiorrhiza]